MANPEYFECFMNGRIHHRRHDSKEWKVGYAPRETVNPAGRVVRREPVPLHSGFDPGSGDQTVYYTPPYSDSSSPSSDVSDSSSPSSDVSGGGSFDGAGASGDY